MHSKGCFEKKLGEGNPKTLTNFWIVADSRSQWKDFTLGQINCTHNRHWCSGWVGQDV